MSAKFMPITNQIERHVIQVLREAQSPLPPKALIERVLQGTAFDEVSVRAVLWKLLDDSQVLLTSDWIIQLPERSQQQAHAPRRSDRRPALAAR
jgi:hypothetical protein